MFGVRGLIVREEELNELQHRNPCQYNASRSLSVLEEGCIYQDDGQKGDRHEVEKTKGIGLRYFDTFVQVGLVD